MRAMVFDGARTGAVASGRGRADAGPGRDPAARSRLRRLPHRPSHRRRRARPSEAAARPGHQIVGEAEDGRRARRAVARLDVRRVPLLPSGRENLCDRARFTGYDIDGGYAEWVVADERFCFPIPDGFDDLAGGAAALRGADRLPRRCGSPATRERLGLYGFGAAAHIVAQVARHEGRRVFAVTRPGDEEAQAFARELGVEWAGAGARRRSSTRRSSSRRPASSCRRRSRRWRRAARSSAPGST